MRIRPAARILVLDGEGRVLLFRFVYRTGALAGMVFWATPGGELEPGESFEAGARRELFEETGLVLEDVGPEVERRQFELLLPDGERVLADERYFLVRVDGLALTDAGWTELEREVLAEHRWWSADELSRATDKVFPLHLAALLARLQAVR